MNQRPAPAWQSALVGVGDGTVSNAQCMLSGGEEWRYELLHMLQ